MAGLKERLIQFVLRGKDEISPAARQSAAALAELAEQGDALGQALDQAKNARGLADSLAGASRAAEKAKSDLQAAEGRIEELRRALDANPDSKGVQYSLQQAEKEARNCRRAVTLTSQSLQDLEKSAREAGIDVDHLADEQKRLRDEVERGRNAVRENAEAIRELDRANARAARSAADHTSRVTAARTAMSAGVRQAMGYAAAFVGIDAAISLVSRGLSALRDGIGTMLSTGDQFEGLQTRMTSLMGSVEAGEEATAWIKDFAKNTPLALEDVTESFALLKSYGLDPMGGAMQAIVDKNEQLGGGMERLTGLSSALGQAWAKQKLQTEEILQLVERGVPVWELLGKVTGKNTEQLQKLASEGRIGRDVIQALIVEMGKSADGAAAENMSRLSGLMSNLADTATDFYNRIANAGALDYVKGRLSALADTIAEMDSDGRLDKLAKALSDAFVQGAQRVEEFARTLVGVDFKKLTDDSTAWLSDFGAKIDDAAVRVQLFFAPFRTLFNGLTSGLSLAAAGVTDFVSRSLQQMEILSRAVPDMMGGDKLRASIAEARGALDAMTAGFVAQIEQDGKDIRASWDTTTEKVKSSAAEQTAAVDVETNNRRKLDQAYADELVANQQRIKDAAIDAAVSGTQAVQGLSEAINLIDTASSVKQLEGLRSALLRAYRDGNLSMQEYQQAAGTLSGKMKDIESAAGGASLAVSDLDEKLSDLKQVQAAISSAKTDVDINNIRKALRELYSDGEISAQQYNEEMLKTSERQRELKQELIGSAGAAKQFQSSMDETTKSQQMYNQAMEDGIATSEELRRINGQRMEEERKASGEAMEAARKSGESAKKDMQAFGDFFGGVLSSAREPLAAMSKEALAAFDNARGISSAFQIDTSSVDATRASLRGVNDQLGQIQVALANPFLSSIGKWQLETMQASYQVQQSFLSQKSSLQSLMEGYSDGEVSLASFIRRAKSMQNGLSMLDSSELSGLKSALRSAEEQMKSLSEASTNTMENLRSELAALQGQSDEVDQQNFQRRKRDLQAQMAEAQAAGNSAAVADLKRGLQLLREIEDETARQRQRQQNDEKNAQAQADAGTGQGGQSQQPTNSALPASVKSTAQPLQVIRLESGKGASVDLQVSPGQELVLLDILQQAGLRAM